jgi:hypothetical protein
LNAGDFFKYVPRQERLVINKKQVKSLMYGLNSFVQTAIWKNMRATHQLHGIIKIKWDTHFANYLFLFTLSGIISVINLKIPGIRCNKKVSKLET